LSKHVGALPFDLIFEELRVTIWPHGNWRRPGQQMDAVVEAAAWRQCRRWLEQVAEGVEQQLKEILNPSRRKAPDRWCAQTGPTDPAPAPPERHVEASQIPCDGTKGAQPSLTEYQLVALQRDDMDVNVERLLADRHRDGLADVTPGFKKGIECITICMPGSSFIHIETS